MITIHLKYDLDFLDTAFRRARRQRYSPLGARVLQVIGYTIGILGVIVFFLLGETLFALLTLPYLVFVFYAPALANRLDRWFLGRALKKSPYANEDVTMIFSDAGLHTTSPKQDMKLHWDAFTRAAHFRDGVLLFQGPGVFNWIPSSAIAPSGIDSFHALLRAHIKDHQTIEKPMPPGSA
jgi:hypothetical protein